MINGAIIVIEGEVEARFLTGATLNLEPTQCVVGANGQSRTQASGPACAALIPGYGVMVSLLATDVAPGAGPGPATSAAGSNALSPALRGTLSPPVHNFIPSPDRASLDRLVSPN